MFFDNMNTARLPGGIELDWSERGAPKGEPLILLHGVSDTHHSWKRFADALPSNLRVIAVTQRGHGASSKPERYGSADFAGDVVHFMDALGLKRAHIVGHSMGGWVGLRMAEKHVPRIASLTLIGAVQTLTHNADATALGEAVTKMETIAPDFVREFQLSTLANDPDAAFLDFVVAESLKMPAHVWRACFRAFLEETPAKPRHSVPAMLIYGGQDGLLGAADRISLAALFDAPGLIVHGDLGHAPHWEDPQRIAGDVARFVRSWSNNAFGNGCAA